jgi:hypothetical protein
MPFIVPRDVGYCVRRGHRSLAMMAATLCTLGMIVVQLCARLKSNPSLNHLLRASIVAWRLS